MFDSQNPSDGTRCPLGYDAAGVAAAVRLVRDAAGANPASLFEYLANLRLSDPTRESFDLLEIRWLGGDGPKAQRRLRDADDAFAGAFGLCMLARDDSDGSVVGLRIGQRPKLGDRLRALLESARENPPDITAVLDAATKTWVEITLAATHAGCGHHLAMRTFDDDTRGAADFAAHLAAAGADVIRVCRDEPLLVGLLRAELLGGGRAVVVVDAPRLVVGNASDPEWEAGQAPADHTALVVNPEIAHILQRLDSLSNVCVWRVPEQGALPPSVRRFLGACFGPIRQDPAWRAAHVKELAPGIEAPGTRALLAQADDARDARAMAALAITIAGASVPECVDVDAASRFVGRSFDRVDPASDAGVVADAFFDEGLMACDADGARLLAGARELARGGARVLVFGAPGSGKSAYAQALARRVAAGMPPILVEPATLLTRSWGETERRVAALWQRADRSSAVMIADEVDSIAAARDEGAPPSGNAYLIRCLTNEVLRQMDAHPEVALIATVNDLDALDPAIRRRFSIAIGMREALSSTQERLAWTSLLGMAPPRGWTACGACVSDVVAARERCRLVGRRDAKSHVAAIQAARATRLGNRGAAANPQRKRRLH